MQSPAPPASRQAKRAECRAAPEDFLLQHAQALPRDGGGPTALVLALATKVERDFKVEVLHSAPYTSAAAESSSPPFMPPISCSRSLWLRSSRCTRKAEADARWEKAPNSSLHRPHFPVLSRASTGSDSRIRNHVYVFA